MNRDYELPQIRKQRVALFRNLIGERDIEKFTRSQLSFKEFIIISTIYNMNLNYLTLFIELVIGNGANSEDITFVNAYFKEQDANYCLSGLKGWEHRWEMCTDLQEDYVGKFLVCVFYLILTALLGMPLTMLFIFLSSYSKKSYLAIWDCAPLLEGIGYSMAAIRFMAECYNMLVAAVSVKIILDIIQGGLKTQLRTCEFNIPSDPATVCMPMVTDAVGMNCTHNVTTLTSLQYYYSFVVRGFTRDPSWHTPVVNVALLPYVALVWLIVFILSVLGLKRLKKVTVNLQIVFAGLMIILGIATLSRIEFKYHRFRYAAAADVSVKFWVEIILHASETTVLGNLIWLGSMKPDCLDPKYAAIITTPIKLFMLLLIVCATTVSTQENMMLYRITNKECFNPIGSEVLLILIPDILFRYELWQIPTTLWYFSMFFFAMLASLYSLIGLVDSIMEKFKNLRRYTLVTCLVLCGLGFILSISLTLNISLSIIRGWRHCGLTVLTASMSLLINLAVFFIYSTRKIVDDYIFSFGRQPERYWTALWKSAPIFTIFAFIFALTFQSTHLAIKDTNATVIVLSYFQCSTVLLPIFIIMMARCCRNLKQRTLDNLTKSAPTWGPADPIANFARKKFFPQRDIKCRNVVLKCKHKCAVSNNLKHIEEIFFQNRRFAQAKKEMECELETVNLYEGDNKSKIKKQY